MAAIAWGAKVSRAFVDKVEALAAEIGIKPDWLMSCMAFESAESFAPDKRNPISDATGLIQFMRYTAKHMGTSIEALAAMTAEAQLDYVRAYFLPHAGKLHSLEDVYMAILWPKAIGQPLDYHLFEKGSKETGLAYMQNHGFDLEKKGYITKTDTSRRVRAMLTKGLGPGYYGAGSDAPATVAADDAADDLAADIANVTRPDRLLSKTEILGAQQLLHDLAYFEVGEVDGKLGSRTCAAVAAFKHDRGLPGEPVLDRALIAQLEAAQAEGFTRPISDKRATGKPDGSRIVDSTERQATATGVVAGGGMFAGLLQWAHDKLDWLQSFAEPFLPYLKPVAHLVAEYWWAFLGAAGAYLLAEQGRVWWARIQDYRQGKTT